MVAAAAQHLRSARRTRTPSTPPPGRVEIIRACHVHHLVNRENIRYGEDVARPTIELIHRRSVLRIALLGVAGLAGLALPRGASASPLEDLASSGDFRVRMSAALIVGRTKLAGAKPALEAALNDAHPAVRAAAASGLVELGDLSAIGALDARAAAEPNADVKITLTSSADKLRARESKGGKSGGADRAKYVVQVGAMRNLSTVKSKELPSVLRGATKQVATNRLQHAAVIDESEGQLLKSFKKLPLLRLDGQLRTLQQAEQGGQLTMRAQVEFSVLRNQALKATFSGSATAGGALSQNAGQALFDLQKKAVENAVASAMGSAEAGFRAAL